MRQSTYLNVILTVVAVLLGGVLWVQIADKPLLAASADADGRNDKVTMTNAGAQRAKMIASIDKMHQAVVAQQKFLESGKAKVRVTNLGEIKVPQSQH